MFWLCYIHLYVDWLNGFWFNVLLVYMDWCYFLELNNNNIIKLFSTFVKVSFLVTVYSITFFFFWNEYYGSTNCANNNFNFFMQCKIHAFKYTLICRLAKMIPLADLTWSQILMVIIYMYTVPLSERNIIN